MVFTLLPDVLSEALFDTEEWELYALVPGPATFTVLPMGPEKPQEPSEQLEDLLNSSGDSVIGLTSSIINSNELNYKFKILNITCVSRNFQS